MHRRALLTVAAGLLPVSLAGCTGGGETGESSANLAAESPSARLGMTPVTDAELPSKVLYSVETDAPARDARLLDRVLDGGGTVEGTRPPLPTDRHLSYDGAVYRLSGEVTDRTPATRYTVIVDIVDGSVDDSETVRFSELPAADREVFAANGLADGDLIGIGTTLIYTDAERERSALVPDSAYSVIAWEDGSRAEWTVDAASETTLLTYRYAAEEVASASEYGRRLRERFAFELSDLSDTQRRIVETATAEGWYVVDADETPSPALVSLVDRFRDRKPVRALDGKTDPRALLVRYDGELYWTTVSAFHDAFRTETPS